MRTDKIVGLLKKFECGADRSVDWAKAVEAEIDDAGFSDDPRFEELCECLASYRPGGGDYLYGEDEMLRVCRSSLALITRVDS